jgi:DNA-binding CsgD family transcriptional regulator
MMPPTRVEGTHETDEDRSEISPGDHLARESMLDDPSTGLLLEREESLLAISELAQLAVQGRGSMVAVVGGPGEGKTTLLAAAGRIGERMGLEVRRAHGSDLERPFALGVARQILEPAVMSLDHEERARVFTGAAGIAASVLDLDHGTAPVDAFAARHGLYWLLVELCGSGPMMLLVDDAHWADESSLQWLATLTRRLDELSVLIVLGTRPHAFGGVAEAMGAMLADPQIPLLRVGPLGPSSIAALTRRVLTAEPDERFTAACHRATGGNPFAVTELLGDMRRNALEPVAGVADGLEDHVPEAIERSVLGRLQSLSRPTIEVAHALAVLGDGSELRHLAALAELDLDSTARLVEDLVHAEILRDTTELCFAHPLVHAAIRDAIGSRRRARLHARAGALLSRDDEDPESIAVHLLIADPAGEERVVRELRAAAAAALHRGSPLSAVTHLRRALVEPPEPQVRAEVLAELGRVEMLLRDPAAASHLEQALDLTTDSPRRALLALDLSEVYLYAGEQAQMFEMLELALNAAEGTDPELALVVQRRQVAMALASNLAVSAADQLSLEKLRRLATKDRPAARPVRITLSMGLASAARPIEETLPLLLSGLGEGRFLKEQSADAPEAVHAALVLIAYDEIAMALELTSEMMADAGRRGSVLGFVHGATFRALAHLRAGALIEAEADAVDALRLLREQPIQFVLPFPTSYLSAILRERGQVEEASRLLDEIVLPEVASARSTVLESRARLRLLGNDRDGAVADLTAVGEILSTATLRHPGYQRWRSQLALALAPAHAQRARALTSSELADARSIKVPGSIGVALAASACLAPASERQALWREAIVQLEQSPLRLELARALVGQGSDLRRRGQRTQAREPLRQALELAHRCGAEPLASMAAEELRAADGRPRRPWLSGIRALTPSELRVASRAAAGHSNRDIAQALFITTKTVEMHLSNTYRKLAIDSREKLSSALNEADFPSSTE